jgi:hypothetical protein
MTPAECFLAAGYAAAAAAQSRLACVLAGDPPEPEWDAAMAWAGAISACVVLAVIRATS